MSQRPYQLRLRGFRARAFASLGRALSALRKAAHSLCWAIALQGAVLFSGGAS